MPAVSAKQRARRAVEELPEDASLEDAIDRLVVLHKIERGLEQVELGVGVLTQDEVEARFAQRRNEGRLTTEESDRLYRLARLFERAIVVFESEDDAREWFHRPQVGLDGSSALELTRNEPGTKEVEALLGRIEHGVLA